MESKIKFKILDKYQWKDTNTIGVYNSGHNPKGSEFYEILAEMNRRQDIEDLQNTRFTFETESDMMVFMLTWGS